MCYPKEYIKSNIFPNASHSSSISTIYLGMGSTSRRFCRSIIQFILRGKHSLLKNILLSKIDSPISSFDMPLNQKWIIITCVIASIRSSIVIMCYYYFWNVCAIAPNTCRRVSPKYSASGLIIFARISSAGKSMNISPNCPPTN